MMEPGAIPTTRQVGTFQTSTNPLSTFVSNRLTTYTRISLRGRREPGATPTTRQRDKTTTYTRISLRGGRKCVAVLVMKWVIQKSLFRCSRRTDKPPIRALLQRGGMGNRCGAYDEKGIFISTRLRGNDCASFRQVHLKTPYTPSRPTTKKIHQSKCKAYDEPDPPDSRVRTWHVSSSRWFRHPNGSTPMVLPSNGTVGKRLRPGPSEPGGLPPNGTIILRSWSSPVCSPMASNL
ncbi:hypothetical protein M5K25_016220 [Dendrobium thyrsiflorum]|uniref:Uncharacterized protein n=1 Tax=Dendrobium thyrsiflorum TaxID=117978 RepID=A0ABD0UJ28_DENTH